MKIRLLVLFIHSMILGFSIFTSLALGSLQSILLTIFVAATLAINWYLFELKLFKDILAEIDTLPDISVDSLSILHDSTFKITLEFESKKDADVWMAAYLDGGGEQVCMYSTDLSNSDWKNKSGYNLILKGYRQCPSCRYSEISTIDQYKTRYSSIISDFKEYKIEDSSKAYKCENCFYECEESDIVNA
jgi:hypothetical protein